jgi:DUF1707 SHOCT-like domain
MPNDDPQLRASDDDRDRTASLLREHHAAGRLTVDEFSERLDATYAAKTLGQLQELLSDLPSIDLYRLPEQDMRRRQHEQGGQPAVQQGRLSPHWRAAWGSWASVSLLLAVIWLIGTASSGFGNLQGMWFLWVAGPWGAILLSRWLFGQHPSGGSGPRQLPGGPRAGLHDPRPGPGGQQDVGRPGPGDYRLPFDDHMAHRQERMQEHLQRRQEHRQRHQERMQRRRDKP